MKAVTEFPSFTLNKALEMKTTLTAEGKTLDEVKETLGQNFKIEGEKLTYLLNSLDVASANVQNLKRILVVKLNEGEAVPPKAIKVEELHFVPEFLIQASASSSSFNPSKGKGGGKGGGRGGKGGGGPKSSPWGLSPEEKAEKNKKQKA